MKKRIQLNYTITGIKIIKKARLYRNVFKSSQENLFIYAYCSLFDRPTEKLFAEKMLMNENNLHRKNKHIK